MIISASRRTDIPAFFGEWFLRRLRAGFCLVPNPRNPRQVSRVSLAREDVDAFVLWTRDPAPFEPAFDELDRCGFPYYVLFTLTGYGPRLEPRAPGTDQAVRAFRALADRVGPGRVIWRYDPILFGPGLGPAEHRQNFSALAAKLSGATKRVKTSFLDLYRKTRIRLSRLDPAWLTDPAASAGPLLSALSRAAAREGMVLETCAEKGIFDSVQPGKCVDPELLSQLFGLSSPTSRDRNQRAACLCAPSRDIGVYDTCGHGCVYCYAVRDDHIACENLSRHDPEGPCVLGSVVV